MAGVVPDLNHDMGFFARTEEGRSYMVRVPGSSHAPITDAELAEVLNWMLRTFADGDSPEPYTEAEVSANRRLPMHDPLAERKRLLEQRYEQERSPLSQAPRAQAPQARASQYQAPTREREEAFGAALFSDTSLSLHNNQSCASCHDPGRAFSDARPAALDAGVSFGSDGKTLGFRNAPSLTYVAFTPPFGTDDLTELSSDTRPEDSIRGGFFWDGREPTLESQVLTPFVNSREMALPDTDELIERVVQNPNYRSYLKDVANRDDVLARIAGGLTAYLRSDALSTFDSRYDRYLRGEVEPTREERIGMNLFFSPSFTSCADCHQSQPVGLASGELFTNHRYENIGTPINRELLAMTGNENTDGDPGLLGNPLLGDLMHDNMNPDQLAGRIKVPTLRNVAVTGPYMHNGVFDELSTLMLFYNHFNESGSNGQINPETGAPWQETAHADSVALEKLRSGFPLSEGQLSAITAFMRMLTDRRYEPLL